MIFRIVFLWVCFAIPLHSEEFNYLPNINQSSLASTSGMISTVVNGTVCAISGEYVDSQTDLTIPGPMPLLLKRTYSSLSDVKNTLERGWRLSSPSFIHYRTDPLPGEEGIIPPSHSHDVTLFESTGASLNYKRKNHQRDSYRLYFDKPVGMTNCNEEEISARTNLRNQILRIHGDKHHFTVTSANGDQRYYFKTQKHLYEDDTVYLLGFEKTLSGHRCDYHYNKQKVTKITAKSQIDGTPYSWLEFIHRRNELKKPYITVLSSDGRIVEYEFFKGAECEKNHYYLSKVSRSDKPDEKYSYRYRSNSQYMQIVRKEQPNHRFLETSYYCGKKAKIEGIRHVSLDSDDFRLHRVKEQRAPVGVDSTPIVTHRYDYHFYKDDKHSKDILGGYTYVYDAYKYLTAYHYNKEQRPTSIERYKGPYGNQKLYASQNFFWQRKRGETRCNLEGKYLKDADDYIHAAQSFYYDNYGNVLCSRLYGNLTGHSPSFVNFNEQEQSFSHPESYATYFQYSQDDLHLLLEEQEENGKGMRYTYLPETDLVKARYLLNEKKILIRQFYEYNKIGILTKIITDNGSGEDVDDFTDVTKRMIKRIFPSMVPPVGVAERIDELYLDPETKEEKLLKRITAEYSPQGRLIKQDHYGSDGKYYYSLTWKYDDHGNVIKETDALGQVVKKYYDRNDNLIRKDVIASHSIFHSYDYSNRLIKTEEVHSDGLSLVTSHRYDYKGNRIATVDPFGNETQFVYDEFGRLIETIRPKVLDVEGLLNSSSVKVKYDIADNPIAITNANGFTTRTLFNARKAPIEVKHPDGTTEKFRYTLDGLLSEKMAPNGTKTLYKRDILGRITAEITQSLNGEILSEINFTYDAFHLLNKTDSEGNATHYQYDGAGRLIEKITSQSHITFVYDPLGRLGCKRELIDQTSMKVTVYEYDLLNRITEERIEDGHGTILTCVNYAYDRNGNKTIVKQRTEAGISITQTKYNSANQVIEIINPLQEKNHIVYNNHFINEQGQCVLQTVLTDPMGYLTETTFDTHGRQERVVKKNAYGILLSQQELRYDALGNCTQEIDHVIFQGETKKKIITSWEYNAGNQVVCQKEAVGTPEQRSTQFEYNASGQKSVQIKPDSTQLFYSYHPTGLLASLSSSDGSISYQYKYNRNGQPLQIHDANRITERKYDSAGNMEAETLSNGYLLTYDFDGLNRPISITLPDASAIQYRYDSLHLKGVDRISHGKSLYSHEYEKYDPSGRILEAIYPCQVGKSRFHYDLLGRITAIESDKLKQHAIQYDAMGNLTHYEGTDPIGKLSCEFLYDPLQQLVEEKGNGSHRYEFDSLHNRILKNGHFYTCNSLNQLLHQGESQYTYDLNGNLIRQQTDHDIIEYRYDALDRLIAVIKGGDEITYSYDSFNRRLSKTVNGIREDYLYCGQNEIGVIKEDKITTLRILGNGKGAEIGAAVAIEIEEQLYIPLHDHNGNVRVLLDPSGNVIETYRYTSFGEETIFDADGNPLIQSKVGNPWRFCSKHIDDETGFVYFGRRYYAPQIGRWITADPLGFDEGPNLYAYVMNCPLTHVDLYGLAIAESKAIPDYSFNYSLMDCSPLRDVRYRGFDTQVGGSVNRYHDLGSDRFESSRNKQKSSNAPQVKFQSYEDNYSESQRSRIESLGRPELPDGEIMYMNGIGNSFEDSKQNATHLSDMAGGCNVTVVYSGSKDICSDLMKCCMGLNYVATESVNLLHRAWDRFFRRKGNEDKYILMTGSSRGIIEIRNALSSYPASLRERILVVAIAPGAYIDKNLCGKVIHYRATLWRDCIPHIDISGAMRCRNTTRVLSSHPKADFFDHSFTSPTYEDVLKQHIKNYIRSEGTSL